jgi:hypothetical protein
VIRLGLIICFLAVFTSCAEDSNNSLSVTVVPSNPILVAQGDGTTVNGDELSAPYFTVTKALITWKGTQSVSLILLSLQTTDKKYSCAFSGDDLLAILPTTINGTSILDSTTGTIVLPSVPDGITISTTLFGCGGLVVADKTASSFNIPMDVKIVGTVINPSDATQATGRATGTASITVQ